MKNTVAKPIIILLTIIAALCMYTDTFADDTKLEIEASELYDDGTIAVTVKAYGSTDILGVQLAINYDESLIELLKAKNGSMTISGVSAVNSEEAGVIVFVWSGKKAVGSGDIVELIFKKKADARGDTAISFDENGGRTMLVDGELNRIGFSAAGAVIKLDGKAEEPAATPYHAAEESEMPFTTYYPQAGGYDGYVRITSEPSINDVVTDMDNDACTWSSGGDKAVSVDENGGAGAAGKVEATAAGTAEEGAETAEAAITAGKETEKDKAEAYIAEADDNGENEKTASWLYLTVAIAAIIGLALTFMLKRRR